MVILPLIHEKLNKSIFKKKLSLQINPLIMNDKISYTGRNKINIIYTTHTWFLKEYEPCRYNFSFIPNIPVVLRKII